MTDAIEAARREGMALGIAMAVSLCRQFEATARSADEIGREAAFDVAAEAIGDLSPLPPHVAAARVLLADWNNAPALSGPCVDWSAVWTAMRIERAETDCDDWDEWDEWASLMLAALWQIAEGE